MAHTVRHLALWAAIAGMTGGCLSNSHIIPKQELMALSQTPPEERGRSVRVVQAFDGEDEPPEQQRVSGSTTVVVVGPPVRVGPRRARTSRGGGKVPGTAKDKADKAWIWVVIAAAVGVGLAATEGARYDGWVELHPMHPVHLYGPYGEYTWRPLAQIDPETAQWAQKAIVRPSEGPWRPLGRAPLNRRGWTYGMIFGAGQQPSIYGPEELGFMSHIQIGYFPEQHVGLLFDIGLGWADNEMSATIFNSRWAGELQVLPISAGKLHAGGFGSLGVSARFEDDANLTSEYEERGTIYSGGGLVQLELTTRLTLTARAGISRVFDSTVTDVGVGFSVY
jgi:hypothetical protein